MPKLFLIAAVSIAAVAIATMPANAATPRAEVGKIAKPAKLVRIPARPVLRRRVPAPTASGYLMKDEPEPSASADDATPDASADARATEAAGADGVETASNEASAEEAGAEPASDAGVMPASTQPKAPSKPSKNCRRDAAAKAMLAILLGEADLKEAARRQLDACD